MPVPWGATTPMAGTKPPTPTRNEGISNRCRSPAAETHFVRRVTAQPRLTRTTGTSAPRPIRNALLHGASRSRDGRCCAGISARDRQPGSHSALPSQNDPAQLTVMLKQGRSARRWHRARRPLRRNRLLSRTRPHANRCCPRRSWRTRSRRCRRSRARPRPGWRARHSPASSRSSRERNKGCRSPLARERSSLPSRYAPARPPSQSWHRRARHADRRPIWPSPSRE